MENAALQSINLEDVFQQYWGKIAPSEQRTLIQQYLRNWGSNQYLGLSVPLSIYPVPIGNIIQRDPVHQMKLAICKRLSKETNSTEILPQVDAALVEMLKQKCRDLET